MCFVVIAYPRIFISNGKEGSNKYYYWIVDGPNAVVRCCGLETGKVTTLDVTGDDDFVARYKHFVREIPYEEFVLMTHNDIVNLTKESNEVEDLSV